MLVSSSLMAPANGDSTSLVLSKRVGHMMVLLVLVEIVRSIISLQYYQEVDIPCYMEFMDRFIAGDRDYSNFICKWGRMYYPPAFVYVYSIIRIITNENWFGISFIQICVRIATSLIGSSTFLPFMVAAMRRKSGGKEPSALSTYAVCLPYLALVAWSEAEYRSSISRLTNDVWVTLAMTTVVYAVARKKWVLSSAAFTFAVSFKMNALFFGPPLLFLYLHAMPFWSAFFHFAGMGVYQIAAAAPFLLSAPESFFRVAFNFSRKFEERVNMAFGFVDALRQEDSFGVALLISTVIGLVLLFSLLQKVYKRHHIRDGAPSGRLASGSPFHSVGELYVLTMCIANFLSYSFSRGVHMQFWLWISFSMPYLLARVADLHPVVGALMFHLLDWCHTRVAHVLDMAPFLSVGETFAALKDGGGSYKDLATALASTVYRFPYLNDLHAHTIEEVHATQDVFQAALQAASIAVAEPASDPATLEAAVKSVELATPLFTMVGAVFWEPYTWAIIPGSLLLSGLMWMLVIRIFVFLRDLLAGPESTKNKLE